MADKKTTPDLEAAVADVTRQLGRMHEAYDAQRLELSRATEREKATRAQFDDLKTRIANAEQSNQFMRGYLARVQEDDVVREELIEVGEPGGEQRLVPKRKPTPHLTPNSYTAACTDGMSSFDRPRAPLRHWVTY